MKGGLGLRAQILLALLLVTLGGVASVGAIAIWRTRQALAEERWERASELTLQARALLERHLDAGRSLDAAAPEVARVVDAAELAVFRAPGEPIWPARAATHELDEPGHAAVRAGARPFARRLPGADDAVVLYAPLQPGGRRVGVLRATFAIGASIDATLAKTRATVLFLGALNGLILLAAAAWILRGAVVRPVRELEVAARRVADGDLDARVTVRGPGEVGRLADAFDRMTASLRAGRESLIRSERLASVGRVAAGVAHEVGNPLAAILGYVELLRSDTPERPLDPALRRDVLDRVASETQRIHRIIQELLDYSRPPRDEPEAVDVARVVEAALSLVKAQARAREVEADVRLPAGLPPVRATSGRLTQIMLNLLLNAADAMEGKGRIVVDARRAGDRVVVGVTDEGPGVPPEVRGRIFDPFFTTKDPGRGTGLGLSVCLALVEGYGGAIRLADPPGGRGARFEVELPVAQPADAGPPPAAPAAPATPASSRT